VAILETEPSENQLLKMKAVYAKETDITIEYGEEKRRGDIIVTGFGPCGIFCALMLAESGYRPIVIERGGSVEERQRANSLFLQSGLLNTECNILFGAGGAGTFSDGKLITRINHPASSYVLSSLCEFGAPEDILYNAKPHVGTDILTEVVRNAEKKILSLGGKVLFNTKLESICEKENGLLSVHTNRADFECDALVLAIGHSARDTMYYLQGNSFVLVPKAYSIGVRIEHLAADIDEAMYGKYAHMLPHAEYNLSKRVGERGVYTFCMCPGGEVVACSSDHGEVVSNGMSRHARAGLNSNSALAVSVLPSDYGNTVDGAIEFQRRTEHIAFSAAGSDYRAPVQTVGDFLSGRKGSAPSKITPTYGGGDKYSICDLNAILPGFVSDMLKIGIRDFGGRIKGFDDAAAVLTGVETRTSSPIRIIRNENGLALGQSRVYPAGEGAGYAGGITSAAIDGIECALKIMKRFSRSRDV